MTTSPTTPASTAPTAAEPSEAMIQAGLDAMRTDNVRDSSEQGRVRRIYLAMEEVRLDRAAAFTPSTAPSAEAEGLIAVYGAALLAKEHAWALDAVRRTSVELDAAKAALAAHCAAQDRRIAALQRALAEQRVPEDLVALSEAASKGEWSVEPGTGLVWGDCDVAEDGYVERFGFPVMDGQHVRIYNRPNGPNSDDVVANAKFTAAAVSFVRARIAAQRSQP